MRLAIFIPTGNPYAQRLLTSLAIALENRGDSRFAAILTPDNHPTKRHQWWRHQSNLRLQRLFDHSLPPLPPLPRPCKLDHLARQLHCPLITLPNGPLNHPSTLNKLASLAPTHAINLYLPQHFPAQLRAIFLSTINYHNGLLPDFRGLRATHWSVYHNASKSGFSFHYMNDQFDTGNVLVSAATPITHDISIAQLEWNKILLACKSWPTLLDLIANDAPGSPPASNGKFFTRKDFNAITNLDNPSTLTASEILWRRRCFTILHLHHNEFCLPVTRWQTHPTKPNPLAFTTSDGTRIQPDRLNFLPIPLYSLLHRSAPINPP